MSYYIYYIYIQNKNSAKMVASEAAKSYGINLYDEITKTLDFKVKVKTGKILTDTSKSYELNSHQTDLYNKSDNNYVLDVVNTILNIKTKSTNDRTYIDSQAGALAATVTAESVAREAADKVLTDAAIADRSTNATNINSEITNRAAGDAILTTALTEETRLRTASVSVVGSALDTLSALVVTKETASYAVIEANKTDIDARLAAEIQARISDVDQEEQDRETAYSALSGRISAENAARLAEVDVERLRIDAMLAGTNVDLNQLQELVTNYNSLNTNAITEMGLQKGKHDALQLAFDDLKARFDALTDPTLVV